MREWREQARLLARDRRLRRAAARMIAWDELDGAPDELLERSSPRRLRKPAPTLSVCSSSVSTDGWHHPAAQSATIGGAMSWVRLLSPGPRLLVRCDTCGRGRPSNHDVEARLPPGWRRRRQITPNQQHYCPRCAGRLLDAIAPQEPPAGHPDAASKSSSG